MKVRTLLYIASKVSWNYYSLWFQQNIELGRSLFGAKRSREDIMFTESIFPGVPKTAINRTEKCRPCSTEHIQRSPVQSGGGLVVWLSCMTRKWKPRLPQVEWLRPKIVKLEGSSWSEGFPCGSWHCRSQHQDERPDPSNSQMMTQNYVPFSLRTTKLSRSITFTSRQVRHTKLNERAQTRADRLADSVQIRINSDHVIRIMIRIHVRLYTIKTVPYWPNFWDPLVQYML